MVWYKIKLSDKKIQIFFYIYILLILFLYAQMSEISILPIFPYDSSIMTYNKNTMPFLASIVNPQGMRCVLSNGYNNFLEARDCIYDGEDLSLVDFLEDDYDRDCFLLDQEYDNEDYEYDDVVDHCISSSYSSSDIDYLCIFCEDISLEYMRIFNDDYVSEFLNNLETECIICGAIIFDVNLGYCDICNMESHCFADNGDYNYDDNDDYDDYSNYGSDYDMYSY
jgi:hypothetical protein